MNMEQEICFEMLKKNMFWQRFEHFFHRDIKNLQQKTLYQYENI